MFFTPMLVMLILYIRISITIKNSVEIKNKRILKTKLPTGNRNNSSQSKGPEEKSFSLKNVRMPGKWSSGKSS